MTRCARAERGAALLLVIVAVAVLTALATNVAYESRVSLRIAANARDALRAEYHARSGVTLSRLVLSFQQAMDDPTGLGVAQPAGAAGAGIPRIQIWRLVPVGTELAANLFPARAAPPAGEAGPESGFEATIDDEGLKVNAQLDGYVSGTSAARAAARAQALYRLVCDPRWDRLFEREDALGVRTSREDLLVRLRDWVDENDQVSDLNADYSSAPCGTTVKPPPWADAYGDEGQPYDRGEDRYEVKNARMDSLDELFLVAGVSDAFMAAFGDALTVYLRPNAQWSLNQLDCRGIAAIAWEMADPPGRLALMDQAVAEQVCKLVTQAQSLGLLAINQNAFADAVRLAGVSVNPNLPTGQNSPFTDRSDTFRVRATGKAGAVATAIDAVVRLDRPQPGVPTGAPGRLVHWREE